MKVEHGKLYERIEDSAGMLNQVLDRMGMIERASERGKEVEGGKNWQDR